VFSDADMKKALSYMNTAVCVGALATEAKNDLNLVNAPLLAKERGLQVNKL